MKLYIVAVGQRMPAWVADGFCEYAKRMVEPELKLIEIKSEKRGVKANRNIEQGLNVESARIEAALPKGSRCIALDEHGEQLTTAALARHLERWQQDGRDVAFVIGGADGLDLRLKKSAAMLMALSAMTLPHGLARVMLAEQLYRAVSMLNHHPYHRA